MRVSLSGEFICGASLLCSAFGSGVRAAAPEPAASTSSSAAPTTFKAAPLFDAASLSVKTLPNGVRALVREARGSGLVSVQVWVRAGGRYESDTQSGVSHLLAEVALRGSQNYPRRVDVSGNISGGPREALEALGGDVKMLTSRDSTFYSALVSAQFLPQALRALADATLRPTIADVSVVDARLDVAGAQKRREADALFASQDIAFRLAFGKHPYRKPAGGTSVNVEALSVGVVRLFHQTHYVGRNLSVVVVGDAPGALSQKLIAQFFGSARAASGSQSAVAGDSSAPEFKTFSRRFATTNRVVTLAFRAPGISNPTDVIATDILLAHWKEGRGAHLRGLLLGPEKPDDGKEDEAKSEAPALGFDADYLTQRDPGLLTVTLVINPEAKSAAIGVLMDEVQRVHEQGLSDEELTRAKAALMRQYVEQSDTVSGQAGALGFYDMIADYKFATTYLDRIAQATNDDVKRMASKYLSRTSYVQVVAEPQVRPRREPGEGAPENPNTITASIRLHLP